MENNQPNEIGVVGYRDGKPSPIVIEDFEGQTKLITVTRKKSLCGSFTHYRVLIDGVVVGKLANGEKGTYRLNFDAHELTVLLPNDEKANTILVPIGAKNRHYSISTVCGLDGAFDVKIVEEIPVEVMPVM